MKKQLGSNIDLTRRKLLVSTTKVGAGVLLASSIPDLPFVKKVIAQEVSNQIEQIKHSACLVNCGSRCALKVMVKNDRITRIEPENAINEKEFGKHQIRPCLRGRSNRYRVYSPDRLKYPMKRIGKRGEGKFERISWDEATKMVADSIANISKKYGNESIFLQYGTGAYYHTQGRPAWVRLLNLAGGSLKYYNSYSTGQINKAAPYTYGRYIGSHFTEIEDSDLVVLFGCNLSETRMSGGGQVEEMRRALEASNAKVIIIDPRHTDSVVVNNAEWLPIRPTTDGALVAGIVHTMIAENLIDEDNINKYAIGFSYDTLPESAKSNASYKDYIMGYGDDGIEKTPQWASSLTAISADRIKQLAHEIAGAKACFIAQGWGPQRHQNGEQIVRSILNLPIIANQFGRAGTNSGLWPYGTKYGVPKLPAGKNPVKITIPLYSWTDAIYKPDQVTAKTHNIKGADVLPTGIKMIINQSGNVLANQHGDLNKTRKILEDDSLCESIIVIDNHMTTTAKYADILLPETTYLEAYDLVDSSYSTGSNCFMISMDRTIKPLWEARSTYDICHDIAKHLGIGEEFSQGRTQKQWIEKNYADVREKRNYLPPFEKVQGQGVVDEFKTPKKDSIAFSAFFEDPIANPLSTPSGKIEIYSEKLKEYTKDWILPEGDRIPLVGEHVDVSESISDTNGLKKYPLQLTGFHTKGHTHSTYTNVGVLDEAVPGEIWINELDARVRNIKSGDTVKIFNDRGVVTAKAKVTNRIIPKVAAMPEGRWSVMKDGVDVGGNINTLTSLRLSPLAKANPQHTNLVEIERV